MFSSESSNRFSCKHPLEQVLIPQPHKMPGMIYFIAVLFCGWRCFETGICRHCLWHLTCRLLTIASWRHRCECLAGLATSSTCGADDSQVSVFLPILNHMNHASTLTFVPIQVFSFQRSASRVDFLLLGSPHVLRQSWCKRGEEFPFQVISVVHFVYVVIGFVIKVTRCIKQTNFLPSLTENIDDVNEICRSDNKINS